MRSCCCSWVSTFKKLDLAAFAHFDPIISVVIRISFSLMERHCSDEGRRKIQFGAGKNPWTGGRRKDISPNPSSSYMYTAAAKILERFQEYPRRGSRRHKTAHPGISLLPAPIYCIAPNPILEYLCCEHQSIALHQTIALHQSIALHQNPTSYRNSSNNPRRGLHPSYSHYCCHYLIKLVISKIFQI